MCGCFSPALAALRPFPSHVVVGAVGLEESACPPQGNVDIPWLGSIDDLPRILEQGEVDEVILLPSTSWKDRLLIGC